MLADRLEELEALDPAPKALHEFLRALPLLPLFHRLRGPLRGPGVVLDVASPKQGREAIGTNRCVFVSVGVAAYLTPPVVLAFGPMQDVRPGRISAPWDTRGLGAVLGCDEATQARLIKEYSISAPDDEAYLAQYLARCFDALYHWLGGETPTGTDVLGVLDRLRLHASGDPSPMTTPEARYSIQVDLSNTLLLAAFADADYPVGRPDEQEWARTYRTFERHLGGDFHRLRRDAGIPDLRTAAYRFVRRHLEQEGMP